jgi:hypothetical protein
MSDRSTRACRDRAGQAGRNGLVRGTKVPRCPRSWLPGLPRLACAGGQLTNRKLMRGIGIGYGPRDPNRVAVGNASKRSTLRETRDWSPGAINRTRRRVSAGANPTAAILRWSIAEAVRVLHDGTEGDVTRGLADSVDMPWNGHRCGEEKRVPREYEALPLAGKPVR